MKKSELKAIIKECLVEESKTKLRRGNVIEESGTYKGSRAQKTDWIRAAEVVRDTIKDLNHYDYKGVGKYDNGFQVVLNIESNYLNDDECIVHYSADDSDSEANVKSVQQQLEVLSNGVRNWEFSVYDANGKERTFGELDLKKITVVEVGNM
jgi:hypothetical protein